MAEGLAADSASAGLGVVEREVARVVEATAEVDKEVGLGVEVMVEANLGVGTVVAVRVEVVQAEAGRARPQLEGVRADEKRGPPAVRTGRERGRPLSASDRSPARPCAGWRQSRWPPGTRCRSPRPTTQQRSLAQSLWTRRRVCVRQSRRVRKGVCVFKWQATHDAQILQSQQLQARSDRQ